VRRGDGKGGEGEDKWEEGGGGGVGEKKVGRKKGGVEREERMGGEGKKRGGKCQGNRECWVTLHIC